MGGARQLSVTNNLSQDRGQGQGDHEKMCLLELVFGGIEITEDKAKQANKPGELGRVGINIVPFIGF